MGKFTGLVLIITGVGIASYAAPPWQPDARISGGSTSPLNARIALNQPSAQRSLEAQTFEAQTFEAGTDAAAGSSAVNGSSSTYGSRVRIISAQTPQAGTSQPVWTPLAVVPLPARRDTGISDPQQVASTPANTPVTNQRLSSQLGQNTAVVKKPRTFSATQPLLLDGPHLTRSQQTTATKPTIVAEAETVTEQPSGLASWYRALIPGTSADTKQPQSTSSSTIITANTTPVMPVATTVVAANSRRTGNNASSTTGAPTRSTKPSEQDWVIFAKGAAKQRVAEHTLVSAPIYGQADDMDAATKRDRFEAAKPEDDQARLALARELQRELKRVGCYNGNIDGSWGQISRKAMERFTQTVNATLPVDEPDYILLTLVQGHTAKACSNTCPGSQTMGRNGSCIPRTSQIIAMPITPPSTSSVNNQATPNSLRRQARRISQKWRLNKRLEAKMLANAARKRNQRRTNRTTAARVANKPPLPGMMAIRGPVRANKRPTRVSQRSAIATIQIARTTPRIETFRAIQTVDPADMMPPLPVRIARPMRRSMLQRHAAVPTSGAPKISIPSYSGAAVDARRVRMREARDAERQAREELAQARRYAAAEEERVAREERAQARRDAQRQAQRDADRRRRIARAEAKARASYLGASKRNRRTKSRSRKRSNGSWRRKVFGRDEGL